MPLLPVVDMAHYTHCATMGTDAAAGIHRGARKRCGVAAGGAGAGCGGEMCASEETEMSRLGQTWLALSFSAVAVLPAHAQVTVEMTKIACEQSI
jgi:hypothetical protein